MTAINDVLQLKLFTTSPASPIVGLNVFWYKLLAFGTIPVGDPVADDLAGVFSVGPAAAIANVLFVQANLVRTEIVNYNDVLDFDICTAGCGYPMVGTRAGGAEPFHVCWSFRLARPGPGFRNGYKRFSGISVVDIQDDGEATPAALGVLNSLAATLAANLIAPSGAEYEPVVATGIKILGTNPASYAFNGAEYAGVGSQVSRKAPLS